MGWTAGLLTNNPSAQFGDNFYGTSKQTLEEQNAKGRLPVLDIEMLGVKQIQASGIPARFVFIAPPSEEELERRLRGRGTDKEDAVLKRLAQAKLELEYAKTPGVHDKIIVNNVSCSVFLFLHAWLERVLLRLTCL